LFTINSVDSVDTVNKLSLYKHIITNTFCHYQCIVETSIVIDLRDLISCINKIDKNKNTQTRIYIDVNKLGTLYIDMYEQNLKFEIPYK